MFKEDTAEAMPIADRLLAGLIALVPSSGRAGSDARTAISDARAHLEALLRNDLFGEPLDNCFQLTMAAGATWEGLAALRRQTETETPITPGAIMIQQSGVRMCLATEGQIISAMTFISRDQVQNVQASINECFNDSEEDAADEMDTESYQALIHLHAAIVNYLVATALPLPQLLQFHFATPMPSLVMAYRLYDDAGRADELRDENKVWHPAFCLPSGVALSQ